MTEPPALPGDPPVRVTFPDRWAVAAPARGDTTPIEVHALEEHTVLLRQSKRSSHEAPVLALLFGSRRALLLDTGATADASAFPLRSTVDALVAAWLERNPREGYELVVAHSHAHGDHVAADTQLADRPGTVVVGKELADVRAFFGLGEPGPDEVTFDLGSRDLTILATPGHHPTAITLLDPRTGILFTGDSVYPGRLYVDDRRAFATSTARLAAFAPEHGVTWVVGAHVEAARAPRSEYPLGARSQPDEAPLPLAPDVLAEVADAAAELSLTRPGRVARDRFTVVDVTSKRTVLRLLAQSWAHRLRGRNRLP
ncbi:MBL fold metallo-hydrolase [Luteimicrobium sp. DT211]|uniref:MBL fold metallo-hydrolase n=1 Tax=Luteimicrobium sp. DT211 TaxID=3393412 RepID=UPI003CFA8F05